MAFSSSVAWKAWLQEMGALRRQSTLFYRSLRTRSVAIHPRHSSDADVVFLLHGLLATAGVFGPLEARLREIGVKHIGSFTYHPFHSVRSLAQKLRCECERVPLSARVHLIGHSLGGIITRYYVQEMGGASRVRQTISLGSPFFGTTMARWIPTPMAREVDPSSFLLARLRDPLRIPRQVLHTSIVASQDRVVVPPMSAAFPHGDILIMDGIGHNTLLFDTRIANAICDRILSIRSGESWAA